MLALAPEQIEAVRALWSAYEVSRLELFGSAAREDFDPERSDVDLLVEFAPGADLGPWMGRFFDLQDRLAAVFQRKVDLVMAGGLRNPYLIRSIDRDRPPTLCSLTPQAPRRHPRRRRIYCRGDTRGIAQDDYTRNRMLRQSVERNFEIIGEAIRRLAQRDPATAPRITGHARIIAFRNLLIHGYDLVDHRVVWEVIQRDVPVLLAEVVALLAADSGGDGA